MDNPIEMAPEIGTKTGARLRRAGVKTLKDLLLTPVLEILRMFPGRKPSRKTIVRWKYETKLMIEIPNLWVRDVIWLFEIGIKGRKDLLKHNPKDIINKINILLQTRHGRSLMKRYPPPNSERIKRIFEWAKDAEKAGISEVKVVV